MSASDRPWRLALPMYNVTPELGRLWEELLRHVVGRLRSRGWSARMDVVAAPSDLVAFWRAPDLLLSQTCGYPLFTALGDGVRVLAAAQFELPGCDGFLYRSVIVVPQHGARALAELRGARAAINQLDSHSGMNALRHTAAPLARAGRFFSSVVVSGSHLASMAMLQRGQADVAAVDCVTYGLAAHHAPDAVAGLRVLQTTEAAPGLPLIASRCLSDTQAVELRAALLDLADTAPALLARLSIRRFHAVDLGQYSTIGRLAQFAEERGYPALG